MPVEAADAQPALPSETLPRARTPAVGTGATPAAPAASAAAVAADLTSTTSSAHVAFDGPGWAETQPMTRVSSEPPFAETMPAGLEFGDMHFADTQPAELGTEPARSAAPAGGKSRQPA
jgi:hypothetical protein